MPVGNDTITPIYRGEAATLNFTMTPVENIDGWAISFAVAGVIAKPATVIDGPAGRFSASLTAQETMVRPGVYRYSAWRTDTGRVLAAGKFVVFAAALV